MRLTKENKEKIRQSIVEKASRMFRAHGIENVGVADVMKESGYTHGGFYNHFASKDELAVAAVVSAFTGTTRHFSEKLSAGHDPQKALTSALMDYLSPAHRDGCDGGCPASALAVDAGRNNEEVQTAYADGIEGYLDLFAAQIGGPKKEARKEAAVMLSSMVGALLLSRAVKKGRPKLSDELLSAMRKHLCG